MQGRNFYHIYLRGNYQQDLLFKPSDFINAINRLALAACATNTSVLAYCFLTNHLHCVVSTENISSFIHYFRMSLSYWYNREYEISGTFGTRKCGYALLSDPLLDGGEAIKDTIAYVLRNCKWHGVQEDIYSYPYSSIGAYYQMKPAEEVVGAPKIFMPFRMQESYPKHLKLNDNGMFHPQSFVDIGLVAMLFGRKEVFVEVLSKESGREVNRKPSDTEDIKKSICSTDEDVINLTRLHSFTPIPQMSTAERVKVARLAKQCLRVSTARLARIFQLPRSSLYRLIKQFPASA